jgi:hypothetical protein
MSLPSSFATDRVSSPHGLTTLVMCFSYPYNNIVFTVPLDFLELSKMGDSLDRYSQPFIVGTEQLIYLTHPACCPDHPVKPSFTTKLQNFQPFEWLKGGELEDPRQSMRRRSYDKCTNYTVPDRYCAIPAESMPFLDDLLGCCIDLSHYCTSGPFVGLHRAFSVFGERYCDHKGDLPLVSTIHTRFVCN